MAYAGGFVTFGQGSGVVVATGNNTETGRISQLMEQHTHLSTPLTRKFNKFSQNWLYMVLGLATLTFAVGFNAKGLKNALEAAVALTVSAIPEGLLSISQLVPNIIAKLDGTMKETVDVPAIGLGIIGAIILQVIFAQVPFINAIFSTAPLSFNQWLFCLAVGSPMIVWAALVNRFDPPN